MPDSVEHADGLHSDRVCSGQGRNVIPLLESGDGRAATGRERSWDHHQDPTAQDFGAAGSGHLKGVTDHGVRTSGGTGCRDQNTEWPRNVGHATTGRGGKMTAYHPKGQAPLEVGRGIVVGADL